MAQKEDPFEKLDELLENYDALAADVIKARRAAAESKNDYELKRIKMGVTAKQREGESAGGGRKRRRTKRRKYTKKRKSSKKRRSRSRRRRR